MARKTARLILVALAACATLAQAQPRDPATLKTPQVPWYRLSPDERRILGPVEPDWDRMPGYQQERLKSAARKYPSLQPIQKERFEQRIRDWAQMSPEQRRAARETFKGLRQLPPEKQHELRERYLQRQGEGREDARPRSDAPSPRGERPGEGRGPR